MHFDLIAPHAIESEINFTGNGINSSVVNMRNSDLPEEVHQLVSSSLSEATRRAYAADLADFEAWGGTIPATDRMIAKYLADQSKVVKAATISRRLAALSKAHAALGGQNPVRSELVRATMRGVRRTFGVAQREAKPLLKEDLFDILDGTGSRLKDVRDRALLLIGFAGGFRRSELVGLNVEDIENVRQGIVITLRKSKTDQESRGRKIGIPFSRGRWCPVRMLEEWLSVSGISSGPIFRSLNKHGQVRERMSGEAVSLVVKERIGKTGQDANLFSGHSLRAGFATSAAIAGASSNSIRQQTGHASDAMLARYIRRADLFKDNAAASVL
ncbi:site-specific integrase [Neorhizobium petrolearium]|uniref:site-specific integrase n=1 Tax=Neorhizobium petrolearium TaxID=515361 RepID=UPI003F7DD15A